MIDDPVVNQERWRSTPVSERIHIFITWLGEACNRESLFIVDDIEAFGYSKIPIILKYPAHHVLVSTRDSNLRRADRDFQESRLSPLGHEDTIRILQSTLKSLSAEPAYWKDLGSISNRIQGHPLAARNVIAFITEYLATDDNPSYAFSNLFESQDPEERKVFFEFSFEGRSIWEAFDTSLKRLELQGNPQSAAKLLQILPFLCLDNNSVDDFLKMDKRWLRDCEDELPDMAMLKAGYTVMSSWLSKLRAVSFYVRSDSSSHTKGLNIHPLISQYMLLRIDEPRRIGLIGQILHLCHGLVDRDNEREAQIKPQVLQCVQVSRGLGISLDSLGLLESTRRWVNGLLERQLEVEDVGENPFGDPIKLSSAVVDEFVKICMDTKERLHRDSNSILDANTIHRMLMKCMGSYRELRQLIGKKEDITDSLMPTLLDAVKMLQGMVRLRNMYPEIIHELQEFQATLGEDGEITE
ncbi:hypothetical protein BFJ71_g9063 [Fusarium oxysporum]|nr:hypothetical protein BFJ71_g9063 [Fusarium oxysporum]